MKNVVVTEKYWKDDCGDVYRWSSVFDRWELTPYREIPVVEYEHPDKEQTPLAPDDNDK